MTYKRYLLSIFAAAFLTGNAIGASGGGTLRDFFTSHGYGGAPLQRRFGNHLFVNTSINGHSTALMIDTGCPFTLIDRTSARKIGLASTNTKSQVTNITGTSQPAAESRIGSLAMGNCTFQNVPVQVAEQGDMNRYANPHLDGLFGAHEMARFGMVIDCSRQMLYVSPQGPSAATSQALASFLQGRGFVRIPMRVNGRHLEVDAQVNLRAVKLIVDTGASTTVISAPIAEGAGATMDSQMSDRGQGVARLGELSIGNFKVNNPEVFVENMDSKAGSGLVGEDFLSLNFAVIDLGGMALYLRHPD